MKNQGVHFPGDGHVHLPGNGVDNYVVIDTQDAGGRLFLYKDGSYEAGAEEFIRQRAKSFFRARGMTDLWSPTTANEAVEYLRVDAPRLWGRPPQDQVRLSNGILDLRKRRLVPHTPDFLTPIKLPVAYDRGATCPMVDQLMEEWFGPGGVALGWQVLGTLLVPGLAIERAFLLLGSGGNGKSAFLNLAVTLLGRENISFISLHQLESNRFAASGLAGKLLNVGTDLPGTTVRGTDTLKAITGKDAAIRVEQKYRDGYDLKVLARMLFSSNSYPKATDSSTAYYDRWHIVEFKSRFRGAETEIPMEALEQVYQQQLPGVLNRALDGLDQFREQGGKFAVTPEMEASLEEYRNVTDPIGLWLDATVEEASGGITEKKELRRLYRIATRRSGLPALGDQAFDQQVRRKFPDVQRFGPAPGDNKSGPGQESLSESLTPGGSRLGSTLYSR